ncbi:type VI secretion system tube protein TssD [Tenacibaculum discolor]|uniref:type VI secretion system tube protein TssD n=1 Tax=Tenacibaculum discolor TaxID=361581 RepID=UPI0013DE87F8|nr:type VI secretion system tube protein TssD [Tenacibaculum discolor]
MNIKAKLFVCGEERELLTTNLNYNRFTDWNGKPTSALMGGTFTVTFEPQMYDDSFAEWIKADRRDNKKISYPFNLYKLRDGKVVFYEDDFDGLELFQYNFQDGALIKYHEVFDNQKGMYVTLTISPAMQDYRFFNNNTDWRRKSLTRYIKNWQESFIPPIKETTYKAKENKEPEKEKFPFKITIEAKSNDIKNGVFGFDSIPKKNIVISDYEKLKKEYKPLSEKILEDEYIPNWISIRKNQTVELILDWEKKGRAKEYESIAFEEHPDFSFEPKNLKGEKEVKITCKNNNATPAQILIKADNKLTVGALNIYYPKPKTIDLEWCFVEIQGNEKDKRNLERKIKKENLEATLKKGLNPALIDVTIANNDVTTIDISEYSQKLKERGFLKKHSKLGNYIERSRKEAVLYCIRKKHSNRDTDKITVYFINQKCIDEKEIKQDGTYDMSGGFSPTGEGRAYLVLDSSDKIDTENIIHEVMHALGLRHTFKEDGTDKDKRAKHLFKDYKTDNYMDYKNNKRHTYKWQWKKLHQYSKLN